MSTEHAWAFIVSHGADEPGKSLDTYSQCHRCGALRHDYRHNGGQTSPNYPEVFKYGVRIPVDAPCLPLGIVAETKGKDPRMQGEADHECG